MKPYFVSILLALSMIGLTAHAADDDEIIEFQGETSSWIPNLS